MDSRTLFSYQFDFDESKFSGLHFGIQIYENLINIKPIHVNYEKYWNMVLFVWINLNTVYVKTQIAASQKL